MAGKITTTVENRAGQTISLPSELVRYITEYDDGFIRALKSTPIRPCNGNEPYARRPQRNKPWLAILLEYEWLAGIAPESILTNVRDAFPEEMIEEMTERVVHVEVTIPFPEF
jgi:hypothetical protein